MKSEFHVASAASDYHMHLKARVKRVAWAIFTIQISSSRLRICNLAPFLCADSRYQQENKKFKSHKNEIGSINFKFYLYFWFLKREMGTERVIADFFGSLNGKFIDVPCCKIGIIVQEIKVLIKQILLINFLCFRSINSIHLTHSNNKQIII